MWPFLSGLELLHDHQIKLETRTRNGTILILVERWTLPAGGCLQKLPLDGAVDFLSKIGHHITLLYITIITSQQFCVSLNFCNDQEARRRL